MKCPNCLSLMKMDALFTTVEYKCESLYCGLKEEHGWYLWKDFKQAYYPLKKSLLVEYINNNNSSGKIRINNFDHFEYPKTLKFRIIEED